MPDQTPASPLTRALVVFVALLPAQGLAVAAASEVASGLGATVTGPLGYVLVLPAAAVGVCLVFRAYLTGIPARRP